MSHLKLIREQRTPVMKRNVEIEGQKCISMETRDAAIEVWAVGTQSCRPQFLLNCMCTLSQLYSIYPLWQWHNFKPVTQGQKSKPIPSIIKTGVE